MAKSLFVALLVLGLLNACGYKGDLYLPKQNDKNRFEPIQTDIQLPSSHLHKDKKHEQNP